MVAVIINKSIALYVRGTPNDLKIRTKIKRSLLLFFSFSLYMYFFKLDIHIFQTLEGENISSENKYQPVHLIFNFE